MIESNIVNSGFLMEKSDFTQVLTPILNFGISLNRERKKVNVDLHFL